MGICTRDPDSGERLGNAYVGHGATCESLLHEWMLRHRVREGLRNGTRELTVHGLEGYRGRELLCFISRVT